MQQVLQHALISQQHAVAIVPTSISQLMLLAMMLLFCSARGPALGHGGGAREIFQLKKHPVYQLLYHVILEYSVVTIKRALFRNLISCVATTTAGTELCILQFADQISFGQFGKQTIYKQQHSDNLLTGGVSRNILKIIVDGRNDGDGLSAFDLTPRMTTAGCYEETNSLNTEH